MATSDVRLSGLAAAVRTGDIQLYPKAVVLTAHHPYGGTEMLAQSLATSLTSNGYLGQVINIHAADLERQAVLLSDPDLKLVITTGTLPLGLTLDGKRIWEAFSPDTQFITYVVDAWPYDHVRVAPFRAYLRDWSSGVRPNLHLVSLEGNDARLMGARAHHMPTGPYPGLWKAGPKAHPDRLMVWGSTHAELASVGEDFESTLRANNPWGFDAPRISTIGEALRFTTTVHGSTAIAEAMDLPVEEVAGPDSPFLSSVAAMDASLKRYRRVKVVQALRDFPLDIYGRNWEPYVADAPSVRIRTASPDHNHAFGYICQDYGGVVNFDPNFGDGTNERAVTALAMGTAVANNRNAYSDRFDGCYAYHFNDRSIRYAAEQALSRKALVPTPAENTWDYLMSQLLRGMSTAGVMG